MSFIRFQQQCKACFKKWNAAFGIVGMTQIAAPPKKCPHCGSEAIEKYADGWDIEPSSAARGDEDGK